MSGNASKYSKQKLKKFSADVAKEYFFEHSYPALLQPSRIEYLYMLLNIIESSNILVANVKVLGVGCRRIPAQGHSDSLRLFGAGLQTFAGLVTRVYTNKRGLWL